MGPAHSYLDDGASSVDTGAPLTGVLRARASVDEVGARAGHARLVWYVGRDRRVVHRHTGLCPECLATVQVVVSADGTLAVVWRDVGGRGTVVSQPPRCYRPETCVRPTSGHANVEGS